MMESPQSGSTASSHAGRELKWYQRPLVRLAALMMALWCRTLRFHWGRDVQDVMDNPPGPTVGILWHNRLFVAPSFFWRHFRSRQLAALISASGDGAWLAAFLRRLRIKPVRGSRYKRGGQAFRELLLEARNGRDVILTPDGSRGPIYDMKPGPVAIALKTQRPLLLVSFNFSGAWRLKSWDRFYVPKPFSRVKVRFDLIRDVRDLGAQDRATATAALKARMDAITEDEEYFAAEEAGRTGLVE